MPGRDGTGPMGRGPMTGRGLGRCGAGLGRGRGLGLGRRNGFGFGFASLEERARFLEEELARVRQAMGNSEDSQG